MCSPCPCIIIGSLVPTAICPIVRNASLVQPTGAIVLQGAYLDTITALTLTGPGVVSPPVLVTVDTEISTPINLVVDAGITAFAVALDDVYIGFTFSALPVTYARTPAPVVTGCPVIGPFLPSLN